MTRLLASVTGPTEALVALEGGADFIDLKDPARGALGAVAVSVLAETIAVVAGRRPVSAVAGDLPMEPAIVRAAVAERSDADFVKIGLFPAPGAARRAVIEALADLAGETGLIAVFFADGDPDFSLLPLLRDAGFQGAMIDTLGKESGRLLAHLSLSRLHSFVNRCRDLSLMSGLAGSLEEPDIPRLVVLKPDYLGFRGALTAGSRDDAIDAAAVARVRALLPRDGGAPREAPRGPGDRIFVRDFVLPMEIGAYGHERGRRQDVRFSVEADIDRLRDDPQSMGDIYSYDLIIDAIRLLAERPHTDLVETLAVKLAADVLSDQRVRRVTVRVEKLELGPGAVGIEITRERHAEGQDRTGQLR
ncbi:(5-formylfuran-3-yl)methyl phosphate synthase [Mangrovicella endophytica]|uniref:(5-formylfuran-3-yl)methyl phosphate synthase n=1 Tax=Mangrovicella endophytica TaxID=2066697 RepID=UPI000C9E7B59|nr:(5-formylfuran-3-yl)methyl phosphate synthase [Mangrovicella endophytica]